MVPFWGHPLDDAVKTPLVAANVLKMQVLTRGPSPSVGPVAKSRLDALLATHAADNDVVFVHAGLRDVSAAFGGSPYRFLLDRLTHHFESVLVPGFTPSFRDSGVYHKRFSRPEFGAFARLFLDDAEYRTDDPIHSILVKGPYRFDECDHADTFGEAGCWAKLDREDVLYLNVGTDWLRSTQLHYVEQRYDVPYVDLATSTGVIYYDDTHFEDCTQRNHEETILRDFNRPKLSSALRERGVLDVHDLNGLAVRFFGAGAFRAALADDVRRDPYFLIT